MRGQVLYTPNLTFDSSLDTDKQDNSPTPIYGVSWTNDASTTMTRTDDAVGMSFSIDSTTGKAISSFDNVFPYNRMKRKVINGDTFVYIPECWFRLSLDSEYKLTGVAVSEHKGQGQGWYQYGGFYIGAYLNSQDGLGLRSAANSVPLNKKKFEDLDLAARFSDERYGIMCHEVNLLKILQWIELGTKDFASFFPSARNAPIITGATDNIYNETPGNSFCVTAIEMNGNNYIWRGIENAFANISFYIDYAPMFLCWDCKDTTTELGYFGAQLAFYLPLEGNCISAYAVNPMFPMVFYPVGLVEDETLSSGFCTFCKNSVRVKTEKQNDINLASYGPTLFDDGDILYEKTFSRLKL